MRRAIVAVLATLALWPAAAQAASVATLNAQAQGWLTQTLGTPIPDRPAVFADTAACGGNQWAVAQGIRCAALAYSDRIEFSGRMLSVLRRMARRRVDPTGVGRLLLHEDLHARSMPADRGLDEGAVDALSLDLYPAFARHFGIAIPTVLYPCYPAEVQVVRQASARATGGPWGARAARLWRRDLWRAGDAQRAAMIAAAFGGGA